MNRRLTVRRNFLTCLGRYLGLAGLALLPDSSCAGTVTEPRVERKREMERKNARRETREAEQLLKGTPEQVFPLLCPVREYDWIDGWDCRVVYTDSGVAEDNCIFETSYPNEGPPETWIVIRYEPNRLIEFIRVNRMRTIRYRIELKDNGNGTTSARWRQLITALNEEGEAYLELVTQEKYGILIRNLERMINNYLETGEKLPFRNPAEHWKD